MQFNLGQDNNGKYAMNKKQNYSRTTVILLFVRIQES